MTILKIITLFDKNLYDYDNISEEKLVSKIALEKVATALNKLVYCDQDRENESGGGNLMKKLVLCVSILTVILSGVALTQWSTDYTI